jgi:hypothetical protein
MAISSSSPGVLTVPDEVKRNTRSVLLSSKNGVALKRFNRDYKSLLGMCWLGVTGFAFDDVFDVGLS